MNRVHLEDMLKEKEIQLAELDKEIQALRLVTRLLTQREERVEAPRAPQPAPVRAMPPAAEPARVFVPDAPLRSAPVMAQPAANGGAKRFP